MIRNLSTLVVTVLRGMTTKGPGDACATSAGQQRADRHPGGRTCND